MPESLPDSASRKATTRSQPVTAELWLMGQAPRRCTISKLAANNLIFISVHGTTDEDMPGAMRDDPADLMIDNAGNNGRLRIRTRISNRTRERLILEPQESSRELLPLLVKVLNADSSGATPVPTAAALGHLHRGDIISRCRRLVTRYLNQNYATFYTSLDDALVIASATSSADKNELLAAIRLLEQSHTQLEHGFIERVCWLLEAACEPDFEPIEADCANLAVNRAAGPGKLSLPGMARMQATRHEQALDMLAQRFSSIVNRLCDNTTLPFGTAWICHHFGDAIAPLGLPPAALQIVFRVFQDTVLSQLDGLYRQINNLFAECHVLPELQPGNNRQADAPPLTRLAQKPLSHRTFSTATQWENDKTGANTGQLWAATQRLWRANYRRDPRAIGSGATGLDQNQLKTLLSQSLPHLDSTGLDTHARAVIEIVNHLLQVIANHEQISDPARELLQRLEPALLQLCLEDPEFFRERLHPARQSLNLIARLCRDAHYSNGAIRRQLHAICDRLSQQSRLKPAVFGAMLAPLRELAQRQQAAAIRNSARVTAMQESQFNFNGAHREVDEQLYQRYANTPFPQLLLDLLASGWRKYMIHVLLNHDRHSPQWQDCLAVLHGLYCALVPVDARALDMRRYQAAEIGQAAQMLEQPLEALGIHTAQYHDAVLQLERQLQSSDEPLLLPGYPFNREQSDELLTTTKNAPDRWYHRCRELQAGDWLGWLDNPEDEPIRLVWVAGDFSRYVFVNELGHQLFDWPQAAVAEKMQHGLQQVANPEAWPVVDDALFQVTQAQHRDLIEAHSTDPLTHLRNRHAFESSLAELTKLAGYSQAEHTLIGLEVDPPGAGSELDLRQRDLTLLACAEAMRSVFPAPAVLGRLADQRFGIITPYNSPSEARAIAEQLCATLEHDGVLHANAFAMGMISVTRHSSSTTTLLQQLDSQLYQARRSSTRDVTCQDCMDGEHEQRVMLGWITELGEILDQERLRLRCQSIAPLRDNGHIRHEILLGVVNEAGVVMPPGELIAAAERYHRMDIIDRWVIQQAVKWLDDRGEGAAELGQLHINLSGNSISNDLFLSFLLAELDRGRLPGERVCFEITENAATANLPKAADFIVRLQARGCKFALDNFGKSSYSLDYLRKLPIDYLKIDGSLIAHMEADAAMVDRVDAINRIAHFMHIPTIAECVENEALLQILESIGVDYAQGYGIAKPTLLSEA